LQELEVLKKEVAALRDEARDNPSALELGELEVEASRLRALVGCGWLAANLAEAYLTVDSQHAGKSCRSMVKRVRQQLEEVGRSQVGRDSALTENKKVVEREVKRLKELRNLLKNVVKEEEEDGSNGDVEEEAVKSAPVHSRRASSDSVRVNARTDDPVSRTVGTGSKRGPGAQPQNRTVSYRAGNGGLTIHVQDNDEGPHSAQEAPAKKSVVDQLLGIGRNAGVQDKKVDVTHDVGSANGTPKPFATPLASGRISGRAEHQNRGTAEERKGGQQPKVETTWAEIRVISKHDVEIAGAKAIEDRLAPKLASMEKVMSQIVSYEKLRAERRKRSGTSKPFEQVSPREKEAEAPVDPVRNGHVAPDRGVNESAGDGEGGNVAESGLERQDTEIYYEQAAVRSRSARSSRAESATRTEQNTPKLPPWLSPEQKREITDSPVSRMETPNAGAGGGLASEGSYGESSVRSWISGTEQNDGTERNGERERNGGQLAVLDDDLITSESDVDDSVYGKEQTLAAAFQAYKHKYGAATGRASRAASTGKLTPAMTPSKGVTETAKRRPQSVSGLKGLSMGEKQPSRLGYSPDKAVRGPWRASFKG
jgi:hypothetical protein